METFDTIFLSLFWLIPVLLLGFFVCAIFSPFSITPNTFVPKVFKLAAERRKQLEQEKEEAAHKKYLEILRRDIRELLIGDNFSNPKYEIRQIVKDVIKEQVKEDSLNPDTYQMIGLRNQISEGFYDAIKYSVNSVYKADDKIKKKRGTK